jgi:hypothetical protein
MAEIKKQQAFEEKVARLGGRAALTPDEAATRVQVRACCPDRCSLVKHLMQPLFASGFRRLTPFSVRL